MKSSTTTVAYDSNASRRDFLRILGLSAGSFAIASLGGCGTAGGVKELKFYGTGTLDIGKDGWEHLKHDLDCSLAFYDNNNDTGPVITQMIIGNAANDYDLGGLQGGAERELASAGKIIPWNLEKIGNWPSLWDWVQAIPYSKWEGKQYGIPVVVNADSMIYLPKHVNTVDSYAAVFDPKLRGKTSMEDAWINSVIFTAIFLKENAIQKIADPGDLTESELGAVMEFLIAKKRSGQFRTFWNGWENGLNLILNEEVYVMTGWEPIVYAAKEKGINAQYAIPKEGYEGWSNDLLLHVGAESRGSVDLAHQFANWELSGFYGCALAKKRGYVVPNDKSVEFAKAHTTEFDPLQQTKIVENVRNKFKQMKGSVYWQNVRPKQYKLYEQWWSKLRAS
jgi:putative spermidine/putrescine transport system substrate-binding protein